MSVCVPHPNFGCLIWHCALFCQNASRVYTSGPGPWEVSPASSGTLQIMTVGCCFYEGLGHWIGVRGSFRSTLGSLRPLSSLCPLGKYQNFFLSFYSDNL